MHLNILDHVLQCPEVEPEVSMLLYVCDICKRHVVDQQVSQVKASMEPEVKEVTAVNVISKAIELNAMLVKLEDKIGYQLTLVNLLC